MVRIMDWYSGNLHFVKMIQCYNFATWFCSCAPLDVLVTFQPTFMMRHKQVFYGTLEFNFDITNSVSNNIDKDHTNCYKQNRSMVLL